MVEDQVAYPAGLYSTGPAGEEGDAKTTLIEASFTPPELGPGLGVEVWPKVATGMILGTETVLPAIVSGEENDRVVLQSELLEQVEDLSELPIDHGYHDGIILGFLGNLRVRHPFFALVEFPRGFVFRDVVHPVRRGKGKVAEERLIFVFLDEAKGLFHDRVLGVGFAGSSAVVPGQVELLAVPNQVGRIKTVGVDLVVVAEEDVEAMFLGYARGIAPPASPFPESARGIAFFLEQGSDGFLIGPQRSASVVGPDRGMPGVLAGHQVAA